MAQEGDDKSARERGRVAKERRLERLEESLVAALKRPMVELDMDEVRKKGLLTVLRGIKPAKSKLTVH